MRLVKTFLFAAVVAVTIAIPSDRAQAFLMDGAGVASLTVWPGGFAPLLESVGDAGVRIIDSRTGQPPEPERTYASYTTAPGDKLRTKDGRGVLDRFGVSLRALRDANPDALIPVCVGAFLNPNGLVTCREVHWFLRERVALTIPQAYEGHGHHGITF